MDEPIDWDHPAQPWHGVDLDGTLAVYNGSEGSGHIGEPVERMVNRVKGWLAAGEKVKIVTARVTPAGHPGVLEFLDSWAVWSQGVFGEVLEVTCSKDYQMIDLWDDRARQVEFNTGRTYEDAMVELLHEEYSRLAAEQERVNGLAQSKDRVASH